MASTQTVRVWQSSSGEAVGVGAAVIVDLSEDVAGHGAGVGAGWEHGL